MEDLIRRATSLEGKDRADAVVEASVKLEAALAVVGIPVEKGQIMDALRTAESRGLIRITPALRDAVRVRGEYTHQFRHPTPGEAVAAIGAIMHVHSLLASDSENSSTGGRLKHDVAGGATARVGFTELLAARPQERERLVASLSSWFTGEEFTRTWRHAALLVHTQGELSVIASARSKAEFQALCEGLAKDHPEAFKLVVQDMVQETGLIAATEVAEVLTKSLDDLNRVFRPSVKGAQSSKQAPTDRASSTDSVAHSGADENAMENAVADDVTARRAASSCLLTIVVAVALAAGTWLVVEALN